MIPLHLLFNRYTALLALVAAAAWGAYAYRGALIQQGYDKAMAEVQTAQAEITRVLARERSRQQDIVKGIQDAYVQQGADLAAFRDLLRAADDRVRDQKRDFETRLAAASTDSLRRYAQAADGDFERCIRHVERFATEAASSASAAHALKRNLEAITKKEPAP
jgi:GrpB-like predicted nucleotidyltransferase (UPF0157 family)